jgi:uncharacterized OB-fold protein
MPGQSNSVETVEESELVPVKPPVVMSDLNRFFWQAGAQGKLLIQRCQACRFYLHPPGPVCPRCHSADLQPEAVSGQATVYTYTVIKRAFHPAFAEDLPYIVAIVELVEQAALRVVTRIVDCPAQSLDIGMKVQVKFVQQDDAWLPMFCPCVTE